MRPNETGWHVEPTIEEVMADPIVHAVMRSDRLSADDIRAAIEQATAARFGRPSIPAHAP